MKNYILGRFPRIRGVILSLFILAVTPAFVAAWIAFQEGAVQDRDTMIGGFGEILVGSPSTIDIVDLNIHSGSIRAAQVREQDIYLPPSTNNVQPPEDCFSQFGELQNPKRFEICVAYFKSQETDLVEQLYFYIDYCTKTLQRKDAGDEFELSLSTPEGNSNWWISVNEDSPPVVHLNTEDGPVDNRVEGEFWEPVMASQRCLDSTPKQRLRLRMNACAAFANSESCGQPIAGDAFDAWIQAVLVNFTRHAASASDAISTDSTAGTSRGPTVNSLNNILDRGESMYFGRCAANAPCDCFHGSTSFITSDPLEEALNTGILHSVAGTVLGRQSSDYCSVSADGIWLSYGRSADLNFTTSVNYLASMLPVVGYSVLALLFAVLVVYLLLGRPLVTLTAGLVKNRNWDPDTPLNIPYVKARHEIGTVARAFRYVLLRIRRQLDRERKLAQELRINSERDRDINSIIAHEIKSPFHNLKNKYSDNLDIARIDTALEAILRIDQAVQSSSDDVFVVNITDYLSKYVENKDDVSNITIGSSIGVEVELRGLLLWLVLDNIIANADRFRSSQDSPIELEVIETDSGCRVLISNDGPAIPKNKLKTIFNLCYTDSNMARKRETTNQGIGLFVSRHYMRMLDGDLNILEKTEGVTFELVLKSCGQPLKDR